MVGFGVWEFRLVYTGAYVVKFGWQMSINDISTCLKGGKSCGFGREEDASNLLWCEHCGIALCFDCDTELHNLKSFKHGHLRVLLPASRTEAVRKCEHGADGSGNLRLGLIPKPSLPKNKRRAVKKDSGRRSAPSRNDLPDGGVAISSCDGAVKKSETSDVSSLAPLPNSEKAPSVCVGSSPHFRNRALIENYFHSFYNKRLYVSSQAFNTCLGANIAYPRCDLLLH